MDIIKRLFKKLDNSILLAEFINDNFLALYDCFNQTHNTSLTEYNNSISANLLDNYNSVQELNFSEKNNAYFIILILYVSIRLNDSMLFQKYYHLATDNHIELPPVINAGKHFMVGFSDLDNSTKVISSVMKDLSTIEEDDTDTKTEFFIIANLLSVISDNFPYADEEVKILQAELKIQIRKNLPHHEKNSVIYMVCDLIPKYGKSLATDIKLLIDDYLRRKNTVGDFQLSQYLIEEDTNYSARIQSIHEPSFVEIRSISKGLYLELGEDLYSQLERGVAILKNERQLTAYMYSFGNMHDAKIKSCYEYLENDFFNNEVNIIDWGCGQGIGTISLLDKLTEHGIQPVISKAILIEPSLVALKRAALHVDRYNHKYYTINKDFDSLKKEDFKISCNRHFHIFSNILDVEMFLLENFAKLFLDIFSGENFIIIASPKLGPARINRINLFVKTITENRKHTIIKSISQGSSQWIKHWTRELRVLKLHI